MKKSDVKEWVKALRSGDYTQGREYLCSEDEISGDFEYCCLGVACDILTKNDWVKDPDSTAWSIGEHEEFEMPSTHDWAGWKWVKTTSFPSMAELKKMGLDVTYAQDLAYLNDAGWSFEKIANKIEKDLL